MDPILAAHDLSLSLESEQTIAHLSAKTKQLETKIRDMMKAGGQVAEQIATLREAVIAVDPYPRVPYLPGEPSSSPISPVIKWSDWQIGEVISGHETDGWGAFNWELAQQRIFKHVDHVLDWTTMHRRAGYVIDDLHIFSEADLVSGNIHYELEVTNEFPVMVATANAGALLAEATARLAPHFRSVTLWEMSADNHGRITKKNQWKQGGLNNFSYLAHTLANAALARHTNVRPVLGQGVQMLADVQGKKFLIMHGHAIKSVLGIPWYGIDRAKGREAMRRMGSSEPFDYISIGHFHVPGWALGNVLMNGSLPGTTEMDHALGRHAGPSQVSFMVHPKHGVFNFTAWKL